MSTHNHLEDEPWLPVLIVTAFRVKITMGERSWEILRRYSDFHELNLRLNKVFGAGVVPEFPPKLMMNADEAIAERYLELDAYVRKLLQTPTVKRNHRLLEFLGIAKQGVRYGVRNYEYDSTQSEGNRYIGADALYSDVATTALARGRGRRRSRISNCVYIYIQVPNLTLERTRPRHSLTVLRR